MKKILITLLLMFAVAIAYSQTTYYWVGNPGDSINVTSNWNTSLDGSGSSRSSNSGASDILIFDGSNLGGTTPFPVVSTAGISAGQLKFINNAIINMIRSTSGTTTIAIAGDGTAGTEDFLIEAGSSLTLANGPGSQVITIAGTNSTGMVSGNLAMVTGLQASMRNGTAGGPTLVFTAGSTFTSNITSASAAYAFGNSTQSSRKWVTFEAGSHLYYNGGYSPHGSGSLFSAIDMKTGSIWHHRATNTFAGNFFNRENYGDVVVENGAALNAQGSIYSIDNLTITPGSSFNTHTSGQTVVLGNLEINGDLLAPPGSTNEIVMGGHSNQTISGAGVMNIGGLVIGDHSIVVLQRDVVVQEEVTVFGHINFNNHKISGTANFRAVSATTAPGSAGTAVAGRNFISGMTGINSSYIGMTITGPGLVAHTTVVSLSGTQDSVYISHPVLTNASGAYSFSSEGAVLQTSNANGFDPASGSVIVSGIQHYDDGINYIIDAATLKPFGISTGSTVTHITAGNVILNAAVSTNSVVWISGNLQLNSGKTTIRPLDTVRVLSGGTVNGNFSTLNYFITDANTTTGDQGILQRDGVSGATLFPIGTANHYLPATVIPTSASDFAAAVFEGITNWGTPNGSPLTSQEKQTKVDAVWNINRIDGSGTAGLELKWAQALEGSTFSTLPDSETGIIENLNPGWSLPIAPGDNTNNVAFAEVSSFGAFSVGAKPPTDPFVFNPLPPKTYGDPDFDAGVISQNTSTPIVYTSSNSAVATIVNNNIHITGTGTTTITANQESDGLYPAANISHTLEVSRAPLNIKADDIIKPQGDPNPPLTITYTGFVYGETAGVLTTQPIISTTATTTSPPGTYPITVSGASAANYSITYEHGSLTVTPRQLQVIDFPALPTKTYGNADFAAGVTSSNTTIPITYTSSNPNVAIIVGNNIRITGAGTTTITASQAGGALYFPAEDVSRTLLVNKANLTVRAADTMKVQGAMNPQFRLIYTGFVLGENINHLPTQPTATTSATQQSAPGYYTIIPGGGVSNNYNFIYADGRLTILPQSGTNEPHLQAFMSSNNTVTVRIFSAEPDLATIILFDVTGKPVMTKNAFLPQGFINVYLSVSNVASGIYTVQVNGANLKLKKNFSIVR